MAATRKIACAQCGASVEYRPDAGAAALTCPNCGHRQPIAAVAAAAAADYRALLAASVGDAYQDTGTLTCSTCGAATTVPATVLAERCPFCTAPTVAAAHDRLPRPSAILPFTLAEPAARAAITAWARDLWFSPGPIGPADGAWQPSAVYLPYWSFDWDVTTDYEGARGHTSDNKTSWTNVKGTVRTRLDSSAVFGSRGVDREQGSELEPWDSERVVGFKDDYLQGVRAETSALTVAEAGDLGHRLLARQITYEVERDIGGDHQRIDRKTIRYDAVAVRLVLMPIWVAHYQRGGRRHRVLVNARSGEVIGERPVSGTKLLAAALTPFALATVGAAGLPSVLGLDGPPWRRHLLAFWMVLGLFGLITMMIGSIRSGRARRSGPARQRDLYVARQGPGTSGLQVDIASTWSGALQGDAFGRATLIQVSGFALLFVALMPGMVLAMGFDSLMPIVMMHAFSAFAVIAFVWAVARARTDRRKLLGLDDDRR